MPKSKLTRCDMKVTTQLTSKWLKGADVLVVLMCIAGAINAVTGDMPSGLSLILAGVALNLVVRILKWWHHS